MELQICYMQNQVVLVTSRNYITKGLGFTYLKEIAIVSFGNGLVKPLKFFTGHLTIHCATIGHKIHVTPYF